MRVIFNKSSIERSGPGVAFEQFMKDSGIQFVVRFRVYRNEIKRCYIVDYFDFHGNLVPTEYVDSRDTWFEVTACNKQYITECRWASDPRSLGSMCQVPHDEAMDHVFNASQPFNNWYLIDDITGDHWIAAHRNPDRVGNHTSPGLKSGTATGRWPLDPRCPQPKVTVGC